MTGPPVAETITPAPGTPTAGPGVPPSAMVTQIRDHFTNEMLLQLPGAVVLPRGTVVELADGDLALVQSLRLIAPNADTTTARLVTQVIRSSPGLPTR